MTPDDSPDLDTEAARLLDTLGSDPLAGELPGVELPAARASALMARIYTIDAVPHAGAVVDTPFDDWPARVRQFVATSLARYRLGPALVCNGLADNWWRPDLYALLLDTEHPGVIACVGCADEAFTAERTSCHLCDSGPPDPIYPHGDQLYVLGRTVISVATCVQCAVAVCALEAEHRAAADAALRTPSH